VHTTPDPEKLERVARVARKLGLEVDPEELGEPKGLGRWLRKIAEHPRKSVLEMLTLRSLKQAVYDIVNVGHFGLASDAYLHFTSPIRRYPDLVVHRLVKTILRGGKAMSTPDDVEKIRSAATQSSQRERASMEVEREVVDLYRTLLMQDRVGQTYEGVVTGVTGTGVYVALDEPFVDVLVRFENLGADQYELSDDDLAVVGKRSGDRVELGQRLLVVIEEASVMRRITLARRVLPKGKLDASRSRGSERDKSARTRGSRTEVPKADVRKPKTYAEPRSTNNAKGRPSEAAKLPRLKARAAEKGKPLGRDAKIVKKNRSK